MVIAGKDSYKSVVIVLDEELGKILSFEYRKGNTKKKLDRKCHYLDWQKHLREAYHILNDCDYTGEKINIIANNLKNFQDKMVLSRFFRSGS